jgi:hypothetical protein
MLARPSSGDGGQSASAQQGAVALAAPPVEAATPPLSFAPLLSEQQMVAMVHEADLSRPHPAEAQSRGMGLATTLLQGPTVRTGSEVDTAALAFGARAFTRDGEIHLPSKSLARGSQEVDALLAHELTHVRQQRSLAGRTPSRNELEAMEAEASAVEQATRLGQLPLNMRHAAQAPEQATAVETAAPPTAEAWSAQLALAAPQQVIVREIVREVAAQEPVVLAEWTNPAFHSPELVQLAGESPAGAAGPSGLDVENLDDEEIHQLFALLYPMIEARLQNDLRRHRDRAGRLTQWDIR